MRRATLTHSHAACPQYDVAALTSDFVFVWVFTNRGHTWVHKRFGKKAVLSTRIS